MKMNPGPLPPPFLIKRATIYDRVDRAAFSITSVFHEHFYAFCSRQGLVDFQFSSLSC